MSSQSIILSVSTLSSLLSRLAPSSFQLAFVLSSLRSTDLLPFPPSSPSFLLQGSFLESFLVTWDGFEPSPSSLETSGSLRELETE